MPRLALSLLCLAALLAGCKKRQPEASDAKAVLLSTEFSTQARFWNDLERGRIDVCLTSQVDPHGADPKTAEQLATLRANFEGALPYWLRAVNTHASPPFAPEVVFGPCSQRSLRIVVAKVYNSAVIESHTMNGAMVFREDYALVYEPGRYIHRRFEWVMVHELGHLFGLAHTHDQLEAPHFVSIMSYTYDEKKGIRVMPDGTRTLWPDDISGVVRSLRARKPSRFTSHGRYDHDLSWRLNINVDRGYFGPGLMLGGVVPGLIADRAGLRTNEIILAVDGASEFRSLR